MIDDLVKRLRNWDAEEDTWKLLEEAANFIEQQAKYIEAYQNQTNILLDRIKRIEKTLRE